MSTPGRRKLGSAMFGFAITAVFVSYQLLTDMESPISRNSSLMIVLVILCPPSLLSVAVDPEVGTNGYYALWTLIALMNAGLYATVRTLISRRMKKAD